MPSTLCGLSTITASPSAAPATIPPAASCALRINGVEKLPCITRITDVWDGHSPLRLDPLRNFPIVSDLVVDVSGFFQRMSASDHGDHARRRADAAADR